MCVYIYIHTYIYIFRLRWASAWRSSRLRATLGREILYTTTSWEMLGTATAPESRQKLIHTAPSARWWCIESVFRNTRVAASVVGLRRNVKAMMLHDNISLHWGGLNRGPLKIPMSFVGGPQTKYQSSDASPGR